MSAEELAKMSLADLAEAAEEPLVSVADRRVLNSIKIELGNIRAALAWGFTEDFENAARLAVALNKFCEIPELFDEGREWAQRAANIGVRESACVEDLNRLNQPTVEGLQSPGSTMDDQDARVRALFVPKPGRVI